MKIIATFDVDETKLKKIENGDPQSAFGWLEDSGLYLKHYETFSDNERLPKIENPHKTYGSNNFSLMRIPLSDDRYVIEAEVYDSASNGEEISVCLKDVKANECVQDLCTIKAPAYWENGKLKKENAVETLVWADEESENYTHKFHIDINEEYQQHIKESEQERENTAPILKM